MAKLSNLNEKDMKQKEGCAVRIEAKDENLLLI